MQNALRASEAWRQELRIAYGRSQDSADRIDAEETALWNFLKNLQQHLQLARRIMIDENRLTYFWVELTASRYDVAQAERAEAWLKYGDWSFKGADPTVELSDFFPTEDQYAACYAKLHARRPQPTEQPKPAERPSNALMSDAERRWWALEIIGYYEPRWQRNHPGFMLSVPWINEHRGDAEGLAHHMATRQGGYSATVR